MQMVSAKHVDMSADVPRMIEQRSFFATSKARMLDFYLAKELEGFAAAGASPKMMDGLEKIIRQAVDAAFITAGNLVTQLVVPALAGHPTAVASLLAMVCEMEDQVASVHAAAAMTKAAATPVDKAP